MLNLAHAHHFHRWPTLDAVAFFQYAAAAQGHGSKMKGHMRVYAPPNNHDVGYCQAFGLLDVYGHLRCFQRISINY